MSRTLFEIAPDNLKKLIADPRITEIIINSFDCVFYESDTSLIQLFEVFKNQNEYEYFLQLLTEAKNTYFNRERPFIEFSIENFRISIISSEISKNGTSVSMRRIGFHGDIQAGCDFKSNSFPAVSKELQLLVKTKANILIVGGTSSGKTTLINLLLKEIPKNERCILIEDTDEIMLPNTASVKFLTRPFVNELLPAIEYNELIKRSLRMRPDRLLLGEIRGAEAFNYLMSISSGHRGSMTSLHADSAQEALLRLEMLIQLGAPQWKVESIRKLLFLSLDVVICLEKIEAARRIKSISYLSSLEQSGITLDNNRPLRFNGY